MFLRFVTSVQDEKSCCRLGVFQAAYHLRDRGFLDEGEEPLFEDIGQ